MVAFVFPVQGLASPAFPRIAATVPLASQIVMSTWELVWRLVLINSLPIAQVEPVRPAKDFVSFALLSHHAYHV